MTASRSHAGGRAPASPGAHAGARDAEPALSASDEIKRVAELQVSVLSLRGSDNLAMWRLADFCESALVRTIANALGSPPPQNERDDTLAFLATIDDLSARALLSAAKLTRAAARRRRRDEALRQVRRELFAHSSDLAAAIEIDLAVRGGRRSRNDTEKAREGVQLRPKVRERLAELNVELERIPRERGIRQILAKQ